MVWHLFFLGFVVLLIYPTAEKAAERESYCSNLAQNGLNACSLDHYEAADAKMNGVYEQLLAKWNKDREESRVFVLEAAQNAWTTFRDAECRFVGLGFQGGSMGPMVENDCLTRLTNVRSQELNRLVVCDRSEFCQ